VIGIVGRFGAFKRHDYLIEAFSKLAAKYSGVHLLIVGGGGPAEARSKALAAASQATDRIHFTGFQPDPVKAYQALDLLVVPSVNEGLSNAVLEAMACGIPALVNTGCGHEQAISHGLDGWIEDLQTPDALASAISLRIVDPRHLLDIGRNARTKVVANFSLESMVTAYEQIYRAIARTR
jgi:L-malate glycosyltransferase